MAVGFRVLLVEDDDLDILNVQRAFRNQPEIEQLTVAHDGVEALEILESGRVDLERLVLLVDLRMPRMNGLELVRELHSRPALRRLPVVMLTTSADEHDRAEAYEAHVAGYLLKPLDGTAFRDCMRLFAEYWARLEHPPVTKELA
jgi:CheY-like chemotaxis protein